MSKSLDRKLAAIHADPSGSREFILADAKDADMAFGIPAPGLASGHDGGRTSYRSLAAYREQMRQIVRQGMVDIMLMSVSSSEILTLQEKLFEGSAVTPAIRANDATDIHVFRGSRIGEAASRPFRTALLDHAQCGHIGCLDTERSRGANLGLYSVTFNNDRDRDFETLQAYREFRIEAEQKGFRHFLEVFNPNRAEAVDSEKQPQFINDAIARTLAGVATAGRPLFLKIAYQGPQAMEELVAYDPHLVVGVLGGAAGTTLDAFTLLHEARKYGARAALFGRKINQAECQLTFISLLRRVADNDLSPAAAVQEYHGALKKMGIRPQRPLADDMVLQTNVMNYVSHKTVSLPST